MAVDPPVIFSVILVYNYHMQQVEAFSSRLGYVPCRYPLDFGRFIEEIVSN